MLKEGMPAGETNACGGGFLIVAALKGDLPFVKELVAKGAAVDQENWDGETPLMLAANWNQLEVVEFLLSKGANASHIASEVSKYNTALMLAVMNNHLETVELLVNNGVNIEYINPNGNSALKEARARGFSEILEVLENAL